MKGSSAERLSRLRLLLTGLFTALNAAGLLLFAWLVLEADRQQGEQALDAELRRVAPAVLRLVKFDDAGRLLTTAVSMDELNSQCPQFVILPTGAEPFRSRVSCVNVDPAALSAAAAQARSPHTGYVRATDGRLVRVYVEPFRNPSGAYAGAVVTAIDAQPEKDRHDLRVLIFASGCLVLIGVLGFAGHALSGRAMRPAMAALKQHEDMLDGIAHDLRGPVTTLRALAESARGPEQLGELLPRIVRLATGMGGIIDGQLMRARFEAGVQQLDIQRFQLDQLVEAVVEDTPHGDAHVVVTTVPTTVEADYVLIRRAVANLFGNAVKYGHRPGEQAVVHVVVGAGRVTVADNGPGLDAARAEQAFDKFASSSGSGLGLAIVRWIAHAHGGVLRVYRSEHGGAMFELALSAD